MKKIFRRTVALCLIICVAGIFCATACAKADGSALPAQMIRVGISYGTQAKSENLLTTTAGDGFRIGFYDESRVLHAIASVGLQSVIVAPNTNVTLSCGEVYGIHLRLPASFDNYEDARENASRNGGFPAFCNGLFYVMIGSYASQAEAEAALGALGREADIYYDSGRGALVVSPENAQPLFLFDYSSTHALVLSPHDRSTKPATTFGSYEYFGDFQFNRLSGNTLTVANCVELEDYVKGVIPNEMSASWPEEALKAQAVCARTYALKNLESYRVFGFDVTDDTNSQVYRGLHDADAVTDAACEATAGEVLRYDGEICTVYYFAADGGATENSEEVWNEVEIPYLRSVQDPYESEISFYCKSWSASLSHEQFGDVFVEHDSSGNVRSVTAGDRVFRNDSVREFLVLVGAPYNSRHFTITMNQETDTYSIQGSGFGHNLGMSQWGAMAMAENHDMTYRDILSFYFTGATVS